jgi:hypothetical protein
MGWSAVQYSPYNSTVDSIFALNGTYRKRIDDEDVYEWGMDEPDTRPVLAVGSLTGLTGDYDAKYTWARKERNTVVYESNPSYAATAVTALSNESLKITVVTPPDTQINAIGFYRTAAGGSTYSFDQYLNYVNKDYAVTQDWEEDDAYFSSNTVYRFTIANTEDNTEDCFTWEIHRNQYSGTDDKRTMTSAADNVLYIDSDTADASLGDTVSTDHDRPPLGSYVAGPSFNGTVFIIKDNKLYFSKPKEPEYFPTTYFVDVSSRQYGGLCVVMYDKQPYYVTKNKIYYIYGSAASSWLPMDTAAKTGTQSANGVAGVEGYGIFHVGSDGVYLFSPSSDYKHGKDEKVTKSFDPIFRGEDKNGVPAVGDLTKSWLFYWENKVYFGYPGTGDIYPTNILVFYLDEKRVGYFTRGQEIHAVGVDNYNNRFIAVDGDGYSWEVESKTITTDDGSVVSWEVESKNFTLQTRRHFPRWAKYDVNALDSSSASAEVILDGITLQTHTLSGERDTRRRLISRGNGKRLSHKISGSGPVEIYAVESE